MPFSQRDAWKLATAQSLRKPGRRRNRSSTVRAWGT